MEEESAGFFKGLVEVFDSQQKQNEEALIARQFVEIEKEITTAFRIFYGKDLDLDLSFLVQMQKKLKLQKSLIEMEAFTPNIIEFLQEWGYNCMMKSAFVNVKECTVRLYLLEAFDLASRDIGSFSDPYYRVTCGKTTKCNRD